MYSLSKLDSVNNLEPGGKSGTEESKHYVGVFMLALLLAASPGRYP
jgi:hypothetical protein